jgi:hypothetical protein
VAREEEVAREDEAVMMPLTSLCLCFSQRDMKIKITYLFIYWTTIWHNIKINYLIIKLFVFTSILTETP